MSRKSNKLKHKMQHTFHITPLNVPNRIEQIKFLRSITGWGLKETKDVVDDFSTVILVARKSTMDDEMIFIGQTSFHSVLDFIQSAGECGFHAAIVNKQEEPVASPKEEPVPKQHDAMDLFAHNYSQLSDAITAAGGSFSGIRTTSIHDFLRICAMNGVELTAKSIR